MTAPYVPAAQLGDYLGLASSDEASRLEDAVIAASRGIDQICKRRFFRDENAAARVYAPSEESPWTAGYPTFSRLWVDDIADTTDLVVQTDDDGDGTFERTWAATEYRLEPLNQIQDGIEGYPFVSITPLMRPWPYAGFRPDRVQITAHWGWAAVPDVITRSCLIVAASLWKRKDAPFGVAGFGDMGVVRIREDPIVADMLTPYIKTML